MNHSLPQSPAAVVSYQSLRPIVISPLRQSVWAFTMFSGTFTTLGGMALAFYLYATLDGSQDFGCLTALLAIIPPVAGLAEILCSIFIRQKSRLATHIAIAAAALHLLFSLNLLILSIGVVVLSPEARTSATSYFIACCLLMLSLAFAAVLHLLVESRRELPLPLDPLRYTDAQYLAALHRDANRPT